MSDPDAADSPLEASAGSVGSRATEAFKALGNETRLAILLALWEAYDPHAEANVMPFSELRSRVGVADPGRFNYHLTELTDEFVSSTDDGYVLRRSGYSVVQTVIAGTMIEEATLAPTEIDIACPYCGSATAIGYEDENLYQVCTECVGRLGHSEEGWSIGGEEADYGGLLTLHQFDPAGLANRRPEEIYNAATVKTYSTIAQATSGFCHSCSGRVDGSLDICQEHHPTSETVCPNCRRRYRIRAMYECDACKELVGFPPPIAVGTHPAVVSFYYDYGIRIGDITDPESVKRTHYYMQEAETELVSEDPPLVRITITHDGDTLALTLDETLSVLEVEDDRSTVS